MKKREKLIDAMAEIDEDLLVAHAQIKKPTRMQRFRKYAGAAMIYVAACLVVALLLPFIIGKGEDPKPNPGVDPIVTETHSPVTDDPEAKKISAADIYETYFDVDPEKLSEPVTLAEVKNIITAAEQAYAEYDLIILQDETVVETTPKKPDVKFSDLKDSGEENSRVAQLAEYNYQVHSVICDMLDARAPETSRVTYNDYGGDITGIPEYDNEYIDGVYSVDGEEGDIIDAQGAFSVYTVVHRAKEYSNDYSDYDFGEGYTILFPSEKEYDIIRRYHDSRRCVSVETSKFDGLELSIVLEKSGLSDGNMQYSEGDTITATVILENTGDSTMLLYQDHGGDFLDDVIFLENGEERPQYSEKDVVLNGWHAVRFDSDDYIMHRETFNPFSPYDSSAEPASMDSLWEIEAEVEYVPRFINESDYNTEKSILEERKTGTVRINVPHDRDNDAVTPPDSMTIGYNGKTDSFTRDESYYPYELLYRRVNKALEKNADTIQVYCDVDIDSIRENTPYAEFVYNTATTVRMRDSVTDYSWNTEPVSRICFTKIVDDFVMILSRDEAYTDIYGVYANKNFEDVFDGVQRVAEEYVSETTTTAPPPETTTAPPETEPPIVIPELEEGQSINGDFIVDSISAIKYIGRGGDVVIPEGVQFLDNGLFDDCYNITSITFPSTLHGQALDGSPDRDNLDEMVAHIPTLTHYYFADGHSQFSSYDGLILSGNSSGDSWISWVPTGRTEITVPSFVSGGVNSGQSLENIYVEDGHPTLSSYNGILFSKDRTKLCALPTRKTVFTMPPEFTDNPILHWSNVCKNIEWYEVDPANTKYCSIDGVLYEKNGSKVQLVHVPNNHTSYTFPDNYDRAWKNPFNGNTGITEIVVPLHVKVGQYDWNLFSGCKSLQDVTIHQFTDTADYMFSGCESLRSIYLPEIIKVIRTGCFLGCTSLETVTIPSTVTTIKSSAFAGCTSLVDLYIPDSVTEIDKNAFGNAIEGITSPNVVIHCSAGSYAAQYAAENGIAWTAN